MAIDRLAWGLGRAVPDKATSAWGARIIVDQQGHVDILPDRVDRQGTTAVFDRLEAQFPQATLRKVLASKLKAYEIVTTRPRFTVLYENFTEGDDLHVVGDTNGSGGYFYLAAWTSS
jgi:hypothetical protein